MLEAIVTAVIILGLLKIGLLFPLLGIFLAIFCIILIPDKIKVVMKNTFAVLVIIFFVIMTSKFIYDHHKLMKTISDDTSQTQRPNP